MKRLVLSATSFASVLTVLGLGCTSPATPPRAPVVRILIGDADTFTVHSRKPVQLPVRTLNLAGHEVAAPRVNFAWMSGDSIPVSSAGAVTCLNRGNATVRASIDSAFARVVVRCLPVGSVHMAGPLDLLLSDSSHRLQPLVLGLDGKPMGGAVRGIIELSRRSVRRSAIRMEGGRVIPVAPGSRLLSRLGPSGLSEGSPKIDASRRCPVANCQVNLPE